MNNLLLVFDKPVFVETDLGTPRLVTALIAMAVLLYGIIWDAE